MIEPQGLLTVLPRRQECPPEAFTKVEMLLPGLHKLHNMLDRECYMPLPIICLSYCWLTAAHPDPQGVQFKLVQESLLSEASSHPVSQRLLFHHTFADMGFFWDWSSLHQKDAYGRRTAAEWKSFRRALA